MNDKNIYEITVNKGFYFTKTRNVRSPHRGTDFSAGIDFFVPLINDKFIEDFEKNNINSGCFFEKNILYIPAHARVMIPSGIYVKFPHNYCLIFFNKGGIAKNKGLIVGACVVDADYQGEVFINLINSSCLQISIEEGEKIVQGVILPTTYFSLEEIGTLEKLYPEKTERGEGAFGSTGHK